MVLITMTYTLVTEESAAIGDYAESGFVFEDKEFTFKELVALMRDFPECSSSRSNGDITDWLTTGSYTYPQSGYERQDSIHYSRNNSSRSAKYWRKAMLVAGIKGVR